MRRSRGVSSSAAAISANVLMTSVMRQGGGQCVEAEPSLGRAADALIFGDADPTGIDPGSEQSSVRLPPLQAGVGTQPQIHLLRHTVLGGQELGSFDCVSSGQLEIAPA